MRNPGFCGAVALALTLALAPGMAARAQIPLPAPLAPYAQPQQLVVLPDGRKINLVCEGPVANPGTPTVILTAGAGDWSASWNAVQPLVAQRIRACAWDRAGFGFSDASPLPQSAANLAEDLAATLKAAGIAAPYILVTHSAGDYENFLFADRHRNQIAGLVLVDPTLPDIFQRIGAISPLALTALRADTASRAGAFQRCAGNPGQAAPADAGICFRLPEHARPLAEKFAARDHDAARLQTRASLFAQFEANARLLNDPARNYGDLPLIVLTSQKMPVAALPVEEPPRAQALEKLWNDGHDQMAALSRRGSNRMVPGAGHQIQLEQPQAVADAIGQVIEQARGK